MVTEAVGLRYPVVLSLLSPFRRHVRTYNSARPWPRDNTTRAYISIQSSNGGGTYPIISYAMLVLMRKIHLQLNASHLFDSLMRDSAASRKWFEY